MLTQLLCSTGESREKSGRCITNLVLTPAATTEAFAGVLPGQVARSKLLYRAVKAFSSEEQQPGSSDALDEKGFAEGDMAVLSIEGQSVALMTTDLMPSQDGLSV